MQKTIISLLALTLLVFAGPTLAQDTIGLSEDVILDENIEAQDLGISEPKLLIDNPFYFLKDIGRNIQSFFTFNHVKKAELRLRFASEKLIEAKKLAERDKKPEIIERGLENYKKEIERITVTTNKIEEKATNNAEVGKFLDKFTQQQVLHQRILQKLETQASEGTLEKVREVKEKQLENFGEVMVKLEVKENIQERLEKNLQEIKGSEFKEFKNLEILKELEERVPEAAREAILNAQENSLQRLKVQLEALPLQAHERFREYTEDISGAKEKHIEIIEKLETKLMEMPKIKEGLIQTRDRIMEEVKEQEREQEREQGEESGQEQEREQERTGEQTQTRACVQLWDPVCGENGKTYSNECFAEVAGAKVQYKGACRNTNVISPQKASPQIMKPTQ